MVAGSEAGRTRVLWYVPLKPNLLGFFEGDLLRCTMAKSPSFTTIWDNTFGVFFQSIHWAAKSNLESGSLVFFHPMRGLGLHEQRNTVLTSYSYNIRLSNATILASLKNLDGKSCLNLTLLTFQLQVTCRTVPYSIPTLKATMKKSTSFISSLLRNPVWGPLFLGHLKKK